ncbi:MULTISPECIES: SDR family NAD(P)-dependent oxidoreductase [Rhodococcus]|jgi:NAD(P)-dependent dehydrogenase (short-subunit alcohol dehydrogenase family)|uniref:3-oxoacyl-ACP reductase n=2 Tax=Rhodococcus erythropolis group TaxID=2840174 RepID=A0A6G9D057_RHOER|nr:MULTISPECIES: SDR family oxidoreductase [Rhodococcus]MBP2525050.1 NAD(P)-dependent dehydrogenase (short-subunit alcohol dehydrogenase family) [Rhodococcus sp. PvP104]MCT6731331.1 SDR family oxidoreductase [Rhodococcus qingshengii]MCX6474800.1 SDR family oxidoreductase [Rhodococcus sp. (in: high G+C Gram-positive bacteria)]MDA3637127.1 SDR family oxidoreductase [Rhodococcus sp. C-2]MDJ0431304.1 SDR family oxidoreductase [Rhodococcus qingshengii]
MGKLEGKVALITGAGQGIGQGIALALAKEGAVIAVAGRTESKLHTTCGLLADIGARGEAVVCDVSKKDDITDAVDRTVELFGGIDILVNNANDCKPGPLSSVLDEDFERSFATGPLATLRMMQASYPHMNSRGGGVIINMVTSAAVRWDASNYGAYGSIKEGMRSLTRAAACEWGKDNIRVLNVAPHAKTPALQWWMEKNPEEAAAFVAGIPLGRVGDPETDIGRAVVFLVSEDAGYLTGATIPLDGGQSRWG